MVTHNPYEGFESDDDLEIVDSFSGDTTPRAISRPVRMSCDTDTISPPEDTFIPLIQPLIYSTPSTSSLNSTSSPQNSPSAISPPHLGPLFHPADETDHLQIPDDYDSYHNVHEIVEDDTGNHDPELVGDLLCYRVPKRQRLFLMKVSNFDLGLHEHLEPVLTRTSSGLVCFFNLFFCVFCIPC